MNKFWWVLTVLCLLLVSAVFWLQNRFTSQGIPDAYWKDYKDARVLKDELGIPTIEGTDWNSVWYAQGLVVAGERLWQMDLIRRKAGGLLSEIFGEKAFEHDRLKQSEDRLLIARKAAGLLPTEELLACNRYAEGVNHFIKNFPDRWGIEYFITGTKPKPWTCDDTMLVLLEMAEQLTSYSDIKADNTAWEQALPKDWTSFIFTNSHRWNFTIFGQSTQSGPALPREELWLPLRSIAPDEALNATYKSPPTLGSNNWSYRGEEGNFLANDPHLSHSVPGIWYANRLRLNPKEWVVGASIPGIPGVILGMNPHLAWSITNTGENVDDLLKEELDETEENYRDWDEQGEPFWRPLIVKEFQIPVKGEKTPRIIRARFTHRGPLRKLPEPVKGYFSRQWLALQPELLRIPTTKISQSRDWESFNSAVDGFTIPSMNLIYMARTGAMGYRNSGTGVQRIEAPEFPVLQKAAQGEWLQKEPSEARRRLYVPVAPDGYHYLASANERIWSDDRTFHFWTDDDRSYRLRKELRKKNLTFSDMRQLQLDTLSHFRQILLTWIAEDLPEKDVAGSAAEKWLSWDGDSETSPVAFHFSTIAEDLLTRLLLSRLQHYYKKDGQALPPYRGKMKRAWLLEVISGEPGLRAFGLEKKNTVRWLYDKTLANGAREHNKLNSWNRQHVFVKNLPVLGSLFKVSEFPQHGARDTVNAQQPGKGPSVRLLWNLTSPEKSIWSFPTGQSGHAGSRHYNSMQQLWIQQEYREVFPEDHGEWEFGKTG